jgi:hypothetical protein
MDEVHQPFLYLHGKRAFLFPNSIAWMLIASNLITEPEIVLSLVGYFLICHFPPNGTDVVERPQGCRKAKPPRLVSFSLRPAFISVWSLLCHARLPFFMHDMWAQVERRQNVSKKCSPSQLNGRPASTDALESTWGY